MRNVPSDQLTTVWEALRDTIASDPDLRASVKTWRLWKGEPDDANPPATSEMPWCRLTLARSSMRWAEAQAWQCDMTIKYELATAGTNQSDILNLFGLFRKSLNLLKPRADMTFLNYLRSKNATFYEIREAAIAPFPQVSASSSPTTSRTVDMVAAGTVMVYLLIPAV